MAEWPDEPGYRPLTNNALTRIVSLDSGCGETGEFAPRSCRCLRRPSKSLSSFGKAYIPERTLWTAGNGNGGAKCRHRPCALGALSHGCTGPWPRRTSRPRLRSHFVENATCLLHEFFWPHSRAALRQIGLNERHVNERRLLRWIAASNRTEISLMDARRDALGQTVDAEETKSILGVLVRSKWLRHVVTETGGRALHRWLVNPALFSQKAHDRHDGDFLHFAHFLHVNARRENVRGHSRSPRARQIERLGTEPQVLRGPRLRMVRSARMIRRLAGGTSGVSVTKLRRAIDVALEKGF
jgi:hypothetical protein